MTSPVRRLSQLLVAVTAVAAAGERARARASHTPAASGARASGPLARPPQFVLISFDGAGNRQGWRASLAFAKKHRVRYTYFLSGTFFLHPGTRRAYKSPRHRRGYAEMRFSDDAAEVLDRVRLVNQTLAAGHELGSHGNGHFQGKRWRYRDWRRELKMFDKLVLGVFRNNRLTPGPRDPRRIHLSKRDVVGIRVPFLQRGRGLFRALRRAGYRYDASGVSRRPDRWPRKRGAIWDMSLARIELAGTRRKTHSMDYNVYGWQRHTPPKAPERRLTYRLYEEQTYETFLRYFRRSYHGNRAPVHIGLHYKLFKRLLYWRAAKRFMARVCGLPEVRCVRYLDLLAYLEKQPAATLAAYQRGRFPRLGAAQGAYRLGRFPPMKTNPVGRHRGYRTHSFCAGLYLGATGARRSYACHRALSAGQLRQGLRRRGWQIRRWKVGADGKRVTAEATRRRGRRVQRIRVAFRACYLTPCFAGYDVHVLPPAPRR